MEFGFSSKQAALLAALESISEFTISQAAIWSRLGPTELGRILQELESKSILRRLEGERYQLTDDGRAAIRELSKGHDKRFWISEESAASKDQIEGALDDLIKGLQ